MYDINQSYWSQGIQASSFDLILCNNVLHNAKKAPQVLQNFKEMTVEGGALIVADTTGENYSLLTSMEFHAGLNDFEDFRKIMIKYFSIVNSGMSYLQQQRWR